MIGKQRRFKIPDNLIGRTPRTVEIENKNFRDVLTKFLRHG